MNKSSHDQGILDKDELSFGFERAFVKSSELFVWTSIVFYDDFLLLDFPNFY